MDGDINGDVRESVLDAGLQLWADGGWTAVTLPAACAAAGAREPDLAAEFPTATDLLCEIFDRSTDDRASAVLTAMDAAPPGVLRMRAAMTAYVRCLEAEPRHVAVLVEAIGCPELRARRRSSFRGFAEVMSQQMFGTAAEPDRLRLASHFCLGGLTEITLAWLDPETEIDREMVLELGARLFELCLSTP